MSVCVIYFVSFLVYVSPSVVFSSSVVCNLVVCNEIPQYLCSYNAYTVVPLKVFFLSPKPIMDMALRVLVVVKPQRSTCLWFVCVTQAREGLNYMGYCLNVSLSQFLPGP